MATSAVYNPHRLTVQESLNQHLGKIIRVTPTLSTDPYAQNNVLFNPTEITNAVPRKGGTSRLINAYILDQSDVADSDILFILSEGSTNIGTIKATANISDADGEAMNFIGTMKCDADQASSGASIDDFRLHQILPTAAAVGSESASSSMLLQAATGSTSVYISAILTSATTPTYAADDIDIILHVEYR